MFSRLNMFLRAVVRGIPDLRPTPLPNFSSEVEYVARMDDRQKILTNNLVIVSLYPLLFACGFPISNDTPAQKGFTVKIREKKSVDGCLAEIDLILDDSFTHDDMIFAVYKCVACRENIVSYGINFILNLRQSIIRRQFRSLTYTSYAEQNFHALHLFYIKPRPVVLVSLEHGSYSNLFPMGLIGPVEGDTNHFTFALRSTSHSVSKLKEAGTFAVADVPFTRVEDAFSLGKHHKNPIVDWDALSYEFIQSEILGLKLPSWSLRIREMAIKKVQEVGSHQVFFVEMMSNQTCHLGEQLAHGNGRILWAKEWSGDSISQKIEG